MALSGIGGGAPVYAISPEDTKKFADFELPVTTYKPGGLTITQADQKKAVYDWTGGGGNLGSELLRNMGVYRDMYDTKNRLLGLADPYGTIDRYNKDVAAAENKLNTRARELLEDYLRSGMSFEAANKKAMKHLQPEYKELMEGINRRYGLQKSSALKKVSKQAV